MLRAQSCCRNFRIKNIIENLLHRFIYLYSGSRINLSICKDSFYYVLGFIFYNLYVYTYKSKYIVYEHNFI